MIACPAATVQRLCTLGPWRRLPNEPRRGQGPDAVIPLIGVSTYVAHAAWGSWERPAAVLPESYYELVGSAGGRPLLLPPLEDRRGRAGLRGRARPSPPLTA